MIHEQFPICTIHPDLRLCLEPNILDSNYLIDLFHQNQWHNYQTVGGGGGEKDDRV